MLLCLLSHLNQAKICPNSNGVHHMILFYCLASADSVFTASFASLCIPRWRPVITCGRSFLWILIETLYRALPCHVPTVTENVPTVTAVFLAFISKQDVGIACKNDLYPSILFLEP